MNESIKPGRPRWIKHRITIRQRIGWLISGIQDLAQTWMWVADVPGYFTYVPWKLRFDLFLGAIGTAKCGYLIGISLPK